MKKQTAQKQIDELIEQNKWICSLSITAIVIIVVLFFGLSLKFQEIRTDLSHKADRFCHNETIITDQIVCSTDCVATARYYNEVPTCINYDRNCINYTIEKEVCGIK